MATRKRPSERSKHLTIGSYRAVVFVAEVFLAVFCLRIGTVGWHCFLRRSHLTLVSTLAQKNRASSGHELTDRTFHLQFGSGYISL